MLCICWFADSGISQVKSETASHGEQGEMEERGQPLQIGRWQFSEASELTHDSCLLGGQKMNRSLHLPARI